MGVSSKEGKRARGKREQGIKLKRIRSCERKTFIAFSPFHPLTFKPFFYILRSGRIHHGSVFQRDDVGVRVVVRDAFGR